MHGVLRDMSKRARHAWMSGVIVMDTRIFLDTRPKTVWYPVIRVNETRSMINSVSYSILYILHFFTSYILYMNFFDEYGILFNNL